MVGEPGGPDTLSEVEIRAEALGAAAYLENLAPEGVLLVAEIYAHWIRTGERKDELCRRLGDEVDQAAW